FLPHSISMREIKWKPAHKGEQKSQEEIAAIRERRRRLDGLVLLTIGADRKLRVAATGAIVRDYTELGDFDPDDMEIIPPEANARCLYFVYDPGSPEGRSVKAAYFILNPTQTRSCDKSRIEREKNRQYHNITSSEE
ncbi:MAG: hypothetical protein V1659_05755, partial [Candidatus Woesearchaeota archaeon]